MTKGDRVIHKSGSKGTVADITREWVYVNVDGTRTSFPYKAEWLTVIKEEGEHLNSPKASVSSDGLLLEISRDNETNPPFPTHVIDLEIGHIKIVKQEGNTVIISGETADATVENIHSEKEIKAIIKPKEGKNESG